MARTTKPKAKAQTVPPIPADDPIEEIEFDHSKMRVPTNSPSRWSTCTNGSASSTC